LEIFVHHAVRIFITPNPLVGEKYNGLRIGAMWNEVIDLFMKSIS
jgi:hypothetical protein